MWADNVRTTPPVGADALANSPLARGCVAAWFASSGYDHAGKRAALNSDKTNCAEAATQYGKAIRFTGSQGPAAYALSNKPGYVLEGATGMTVLMAATVQTGAARTLVSVLGTTTADNSWKVDVNSSGTLSFSVSNASSSSRAYTSTAAITSNKRGIFGAVWRGSDDLCGLYIDGAEIAGTKSGSARSNIDPTISLPISIGAPAVATNNKLVGSVEWMLVFNRALSPAEIRSLTDNPYQIVAANAPLWLDVVTGGSGGSATPPGVLAASATGGASATGAAHTSPAGATSAAAIGTATATGGTSIPGTATPAGVSTAASIGAPATSGAANIDVSGVAATAAVGTAVASGASAPTAYPGGVAATTAIGTAVATGAGTATANGVAATASLGAVVASGPVSATASPAGVWATAYLGAAYASVGATLITGVRGAQLAALRRPTGSGATSHSPSGVGQLLRRNT